MFCTIRMLTFTSLAFGGVGVVILSLAVSTDSWIYIREPAVMDSEKGKVLKFQNSRSGLWRKCSIKENFPDICFKIEVASGKTPGKNETVADAVAEAVNSFPALPVIALVLLVLASISSVISNIREDGKILVSAVLYILAGLCLAVGIILFISAVNDEIAHKPGAQQEHPTITYWYGWSFVFAGLSFAVAETAAVIGVAIFFLRNSNLDDMVQIIPGLEEKIPKGKQPVETLGYTNFHVIT